MAQNVEVHTHCEMCNGTGTYTGGWQNPVSVPCPRCGGDGRKTVGFVLLDPGLEDVMNKLNDIKEKVDEIKEVVDGL